MEAGYVLKGAEENNTSCPPLESTITQSKVEEKWKEDSREGDPAWFHGMNPKWSSKMQVRFNLFTYELPIQKVVNRFFHKILKFCLVVTLDHTLSSQVRASIQDQICD
jgi:hypothetical protein